MDGQTDITWSIIMKIKCRMGLQWLGCVLLTLLQMTPPYNTQMVPCDLIPATGCHCWDPEYPQVECVGNLTEVPSSIKEEFIVSLQLSHNWIMYLSSGENPAGMV